MLTKTEALRMLDAAPQTNEPSRINKGLTQAQVVSVIRGMVLAKNVPDPLTGLYEKRVWQAYRNRVRPEYDA